MLFRFINWLNGSPIVEWRPSKKTSTSKVKIVLVMLAGGYRGPVVRPAFESVQGWVDAVLLVDSGTADDVIAVAREIFPDEMLHVVKLPGDKFDTATARNFGLAEAAKIDGMTWIVILDTDERLHPICDLREILAKTRAETVRVWSRDGIQQYTKDRFIRINSTGRYQCPVHEIFVHEGATEVLSPKLVTFSELPKTPEQTQANAVSIEKACREWLVSEPGTYRAAYYIADSLDVQHKKFEAIEAFRAAATLAKNDTEHGEAMLRVAQLQAMMGQFEDCRLTCLSAMFTTTHMPEFPWLMALMHLERREWGHALDCANMAISLGRTTNLATVRNLIPTLKVEIAHTYGPWAIRAGALGNMGLEEDARKATKVVEQLKDNG